jgi:hypothetical protein
MGWRWLPLATPQFRLCFTVYIYMEIKLSNRFGCLASSSILTMEEESESTTGPLAMEKEIETTTGPNWLDLPSDLTENILQRLGIEIVTSACRVCTQWLKICKDPLMWRTIRMCYVPGLSYLRFRRIFYNFVKRSCGHLQDINIEYYCTDDILKCIADK